MKKGTSKSKWILVAASFVIFALGAYFYTGGSQEKLTHGKDAKPMRQAKTVDVDDLPMAWEQAESFEEVQDFFEKQNPGLKLARERGLTTFPQQSSKIPGRDGRVQINEVWHSGHTIHLFYSIDLSAIIEEDSDHPAYLNRLASLEGLQIEETEENEEKSFQTHSRELHPRDTIIFENRAYTLTQTPPISEDWNYQTSPIQIEDSDKEFMTSLKLRIGNDTVTTDPMPVRYTHDKEAHILKTYTSDESFEENGLTIKPLEVELGISSSQATFKIEDEEGSRVHALEAVFQTENGPKHSVKLFLNPTEEQNIYEAPFHALGEETENLSLVLESIHVQDDSSYSFDVDLTQLNNRFNQAKQIEEKVAEAHNTDIILDNITTHGSQHISLGMVFDPQQEGQDERVIASDLFTLPAASQERKSHVEVKSDDGFTTEAHFNGNDRHGDINFPGSQFKESDTLTVTVGKMVYARKLNHTFELK